MGCGESKHAIATENTISKSESKQSRDVSNEKVENKLENVENSSTLVQEIEEEKKEEGSKNGEPKVVQKEGGEKEKKEDDVKEDLKEEDDEKKELKEEEVKTDAKLDGEPVKEKEEEEEEAAVAPPPEIEASVTTPSGGEPEKTPVTNQENVVEPAPEEPKTN